jgi:4-hydroxyphenylacetate 3-monooxygenase
LGNVDPRFADNARNYYTYLRENDLCLTHTLINPQSNRAVGASQQADPFLAARVKDETDAGLVIRGARMLATLPMADEILVFPSTLLKAGPDDAPDAYAVAVCTASGPSSCAARRWIWRRCYDHPFSASKRWMQHLRRRVCALGAGVHVPRRGLATRPGARSLVHMAPGGVKNVAKTEYLLAGLAGRRHWHRGLPACAGKDQ